MYAEVAMETFRPPNWIYIGLKCVRRRDELFTKIERREETKKNPSFRKYERSEKFNWANRQPDVYIASKM